jgi:DNA-binding NtrC family response regulator
MLHETAVMVDKPVDLAEYNWQAHSVLVVDDEEGMRNFLERTLARRCGMVQAAADAEHAAALMARLHFDLLILDIALPGKSGIEWLHELREHGYTGDVILVTAFADMETAIDALRGGASDFILKPFRVDQILNRSSAASSVPAWRARTSCCGASSPDWPPTRSAWSATHRRSSSCVA